MFIGQGLRYPDLIIFIWEKTYAKKMLSNEEVVIVLKRHIYFDTDQKATAIDCFATSVLTLWGRNYFF